jgi:hypothetical protein
MFQLKLVTFGTVSDPDFLDFFREIYIINDMKQKIGKSLANSAISIKGVIFIFAAIILTSVYYAQEEGEIRTRLKKIL